jgi:hypothetical protein
MAAIQRIKITKDIVVAGEIAAAGDIFEVPRPLAQMLIGSQCAEEYLQPGEKSSAPEVLTTVSTVQTGDPAPRKIGTVSKLPKPKTAESGAAGGAAGGAAAADDPTKK